MASCPPFATRVFLSCSISDSCQKHQILFPHPIWPLSAVGDFPFSVSDIPTRILLQEDDSLSDRESIDGDDEALQNSGMIKGPWQKSVRPLF